MSDRSRIWPRGIPHVGQTARRSRAVAARDIALVTDISGDRNPLHYDEAAARWGNREDSKIVVPGG